MAPASPYPMEAKDELVMIRTPSFCLKDCIATVSDPPLLEGIRDSPSSIRLDSSE